MRTGPPVRAANREWDRHPDQRAWLAQAADLGFDVIAPAIPPATLGRVILDSSAIGGNIPFENIWPSRTLASGASLQMEVI